MTWVVIHDMVFENRFHEQWFMFCIYVMSSEYKVYERFSWFHPPPPPLPHPPPSLPHTVPRVQEEHVHVGWCPYLSLPFTLIHLFCMLLLQGSCLPPSYSYLATLSPGAGCTARTVGRACKL